MDSSDLSPAQAEVLRRWAGKNLEYLGRMKRRMESLGFPQDDHLYRQALAAFNGMHGLHMAAHYASCTSGVGRAPRVSSRDGK